MIFLCLETATRNCSVALVKDNVLIDLLERQETEFIHAEALHQMMKDLLERNSISPKQLNGIAVGSGPGSYTGLRIGVTAAKGMAYALNITLVAITTGELLVEAAAEHSEKTPVALLDARRQDAYVLLNGKWTFASINQEWRKSLGQGPFIFIGDAANKTEEFRFGNDEVETTFPSAKYFANLLPKECGKFEEEMAQIEPFYMKEFVPTEPKKNTLNR